MKKVIRIVLVLLVFASAAMGIAWKLSENKKAMEESAAAAQVTSTSVLVTVAQPAQTTLKGEFQVLGTLKPNKEVSVIASNAGRLTQLNFSNGDFVAEGKVVAAIDNELLHNELSITRINLEKTEKDVQRLSNLVAEGGVPQQQVDDAKLGIENLRAKIKGLEKQIADTYIKAPISGVISGKTAETGSFVSPPMKLADITQINKLLMQVYVRGEEVIELKKGQTAQVDLDLFPDDHFQGKITFIDVKADASKRYLVEIELDNRNQSLKGGMTGHVHFRTGKDLQAMVIPRDCIVGSLRDAQVYVVKGNIAQLRKVETGEIIEDQVQITSGLEPGEQVVLSGQINLQDGMAVSIKQ